MFIKKEHVVILLKDRSSFIAWGGLEDYFLGGNRSIVRLTEGRISLRAQKRGGGTKYHSRARADVMMAIWHSKKYLCSFQALGMVSFWYVN